MVLFYGFCRFKLWVVLPLETCYQGKTLTLPLMRLIKNTTVHLIGKHYGTCMKHKCFE